MEFLSQCNINEAMGEMHVIAYVYHWDRATLWRLPISERKKWVQIILDQKELENKQTES